MIKPGRIVEDFVNLIGLAPTFLKAAERPLPDAMNGRSLVLVYIKGKGMVEKDRDFEITGRERHVSQPIKIIFLIIWGIKAN